MNYAQTRNNYYINISWILNIQNKHDTILCLCIKSFILLISHFKLFNYNRFSGDGGSVIHFFSDKRSHFHKS